MQLSLQFFPQDLYPAKRLLRYTSLVSRTSRVARGYTSPHKKQQVTTHLILLLPRRFK